MIDSRVSQVLPVDKGLRRRNLLMLNLHRHIRTHIAIMLINSNIRHRDVLAVRSPLAAGRFLFRPYVLFSSRCFQMR